VVLAVMYLVNDRLEICGTSGLGRGAVEFFAVLTLLKILEDRRPGQDI
jgi:hypothetical protein